jgi:hypothetical protein
MLEVPPGVEVAPPAEGEERIDDLTLAWAGCPLPGVDMAAAAAAAGVAPPPAPGGVGDPAGAGQHTGPGAAPARRLLPLIQPVEEVSLLGCLRRFIRPDRVTGHTCGGCGATGDATKQVSLRRLPPVLCLHIKRFKLDERHNRWAGAPLGGARGPRAGAIQGPGFPACLARAPVCPPPPSPLPSRLAPSCPALPPKGCTSCRCRSASRSARST